MSFLADLDDVSPTNPFERMGYAQNPFPVRGQVFPQVYVARAELGELQTSLVRFLRGTGSGRLWAVEGDPGLGKTNFLSHLDTDFLDRRARGQLLDLRHVRLASQQVAPRTLAQSLLLAIGEQPLLTLLQQRKLVVPESLMGTDLESFFIKVAGHRADPLIDHTRFLVRWLGGHQTYSWERQKFGVVARERLAPAIGFVYLRFLLDALAEAGIVKRVVLLLDEFEDLHALAGNVESDYVMALKGMVNAFNWERLFVVVAGTEGAFGQLGQRYPSLQSRWTRVRLQGVTSADEAVGLARAYEQHFHNAWADAGPARVMARQLEPDEERIKLIYLRESERRKGREVVQRDLLHALHEWMEQQSKVGPAGLRPG
jgi:hypothetical protein